MSKSKCIIILSEKSSGSSACQNIICKLGNAKHVAHTRHFEHETLYWTKAASILGLKQLSTLDSEVPIRQDKAKKDLVDLLQQNLPGFAPPAEEKELIFEGWKRLCEAYGPIFLEKSPHHLYQWSSIQLLLECMETHPEIDFLLIGLIRNPMDTIYSNFTRWHTPPEKLQFQWMAAYENLRKLQKLVGEKVVLVRYEDMVDSLDCMQPVFRFCGQDAKNLSAKALHRKSLCKWKKDKRFGFVLAEPVKQLALSYGYPQTNLDNEPNFAWPFYRVSSRLLYKGKTLLRKILFRRANQTAGPYPGMSIPPQRWKPVSPVHFSSIIAAATAITSVTGRP